MNIDKLILSAEDVMKWKINKSINPISKRKIKVNGKLYKFFELKYNNFFPLGFDVFDSIDERDPVSLKYFYKYDSSNNKKLEYRDVSNLILYKKNENIIRCFEKETLQYLKSYNILIHPVSKLEIPENIFKSIEVINTEIELSLEDKALMVFQIFTNISIFVDYKKFMELDKKNLLTLNYETKDFYYQNFSISDRKKIDKVDGKQFFNLTSEMLKEKSNDEIKLYLLNQIQNLLECKEEDLKIMINYILLGGLSLVIEEVKEYYNNFNFSF